MPDPLGATDEDLTVLVRHGSVLTITRRHSGAAQDWVRHAAFRAAVDATIIWDPQRYRYDAKHLADLHVPRAHAAAGAAARAAAGSSPGSPRRCSCPQARGRRSQGARGHDAQRLTRRGSRSRPSPGYWARTSDRVKTEAVAALLHNGLAEVLTAHDLRGFGLMTGMALSGGSAQNASRRRRRSVRGAPLSAPGALPPRSERLPMTW